MKDTRWTQSRRERIMLFGWSAIYLGHPGMNANVYVLAMVGHLKNVSPTFTQMPNRITNVEFTTVSPTIANTMLCAVLLSL
ncbi:MAG: hypothetical protein SFU99_13760 [Saprospiraceae bacterium]|nr:hypothetical protein [Saprospiraceae bacterium]